MGEVENRLLRLIEAARLIPEGKLLAGSGLPIISAYISAFLNDGVEIIFDSGIICPELSLTPISVSDARILNARSFVSMRECLGPLLNKGRVETAIIGAGQIDLSAAVNSSYVNGIIERKRLPGAGGAPAIVRGVKTVIIVLDHEPRRFPRQCDYVSSHPFAGMSDKFSGYAPSRCEEVVVVSDKCVMLAKGVEPRFRLLRVMPGVSPDEIIEKTPFLDDAGDAGDAGVVRQPDSKELAALQAALGESVEKWNVPGRAHSKINVEK